MNTNKSFYARILTGCWPYWTGAVILGFLNVMLTIFYKPWGITNNITNWGLIACSWLDGHPGNWCYFRNGDMNLQPINLLYDKGTIVNIGLVLGVLLAATAASEFRIKRVKSVQQVLLGITGGILMGYGARLSFGCNIGAFIGGIASQSLHGWVFAVFLFLGSASGCLFLRHFLTKSGN